MGEPVVVVIEDDPLVQRLLADLLEEEGYRVHTCGSGLEAIHTLEEQDPAAVLLDINDINLPGRTGMQVLSDLRADPRFTGLPVVVISGQPTFGDRAHRLADAVLTKPLDLGQLLDALRLSRVGYGRTA